jgi:outer membrane immunogenic protein
MKKILLAGMAVAMMAGGTAMAADLPTRAPTTKAPVIVPPVAIWTGCYIGGHGGWKFGRSEHTNVFAPNAGVSLAGEFDIDGAIAGGQIGCNFQNGQFVFGIEVDGSWTNTKGSARDVAPFNTNFQIETNEKWLSTVRGRLGPSFGNWLIYVTGGIAFAGVEARAFDTTFPSFGASEKKTMTGWTVGAGAEWLLGSGWSMKGEYLYVDLGDKRFFDPAPPCCVSRDVEVRQHIGRIGINYRFGGGAVVARY